MKTILIDGADFPTLHLFLKQASIELEFPEFSGNNSAEEDDDNGTASGVIHIFSTTDWSYLTTITNPNKYTTSTSDRFGYTIRATNDYLVTGVPAENQGSGAVYIFKA